MTLSLALAFAGTTLIMLLPAMLPMPRTRRARADG
jgi:hypothetical protein